MSVPVWAFIANATNHSMKMENDSSGNQIYIGWVTPGKWGSTALPIWRIMKQTFDANGNTTDITWPEGSPAFAFSWDSRASYTYS